MSDKIARLVAALALFVALTGAGVAYVAARRAELTICDFRQTLIQQRQANRQYLEDVTPGKDGVIKRERVKGITDQDIQAGIKRQTLTINSLNNARCD